MSYWYTLTTCDVKNIHSYIHVLFLVTGGNLYIENWGWKQEGSSSLWLSVIVGVNRQSYILDMDDAVWEKAKTVSPAIVGSPSWSECGRGIWATEDRVTLPSLYDSERDMLLDLAHPQECKNMVVSASFPLISISTH